MEDVWDIDGRPLDLSAAGDGRSFDESGNAAAVVDAASADVAASVLEAEVGQARGPGWVPLHDAPRYQLVPAAWPPTLRSWLHDPRRVDDDWPGYEAARLPPALSGRAVAAALSVAGHPRLRDL